MKKLVYVLYVLLATSSLVFTQCEEDTKVGDSIGKASKLIYFPVIKLKGDQTMVIDKGTPFADPGAEATVQGAPVDPTIAGSVNTNAPGIYYLSYTAKNKLDYAASVYRVVIVKNAKATNPDYSGKWKRDAGAEGVSTWIQLTSISYAVSNPGGATAPYTDFWCVATMEGKKPSIKNQKTYQILGGSLVSVYTESESAFSGTTAGSTYAWSLNTPGFGKGLRTFVKQ